MPVGRAVLLIPPQQFPTSCKNAAKSFSCHRSENSPVSPLLATLPKIAVCKSFVCHTSDTPRGPSACFSPLSLRATASLRDHLFPFRSLARYQPHFLPGPAALAMVLSFSLCNNG